MIAYLDTQVVVRLVQGNYDQITTKAKAAIESSDLLISPMVGIELEYLHEIGRLLVGGAELVLKLKSDIGLEICPQPFPGIAAIAMTEKWTRDPFDRIIVAQAKWNGVAPLITSDEAIRANYINALW